MAIRAFFRPLAVCVSESPLTTRSEEHTSELQSRENLVCRLLLEKKKTAAEPSAQPQPAGRSQSPAPSEEDRPRRTPKRCPVRSRPHAAQETSAAQQRGNYG